MKRSLCFVLGLAAGLSAQDFSISGKVTDPAGKPLAGVVVRLLASQVVDTTEADGAYLLVNPPSIRILPRLFADPGSMENRLLLGTSPFAGAGWAMHTLQGRRIPAGASLAAGPLVLDRASAPASSPASSSPASSVVASSSPASRSTNHAASQGAGPPSPLSKAAAETWLQAFKPGYAVFIQKVAAATGILDVTLSPSAAPDFGPNVLIFDPSMPMASIQSQIDTIHRQQVRSQFGLGRYALLFKPGAYSLNVDVGYYTQAAGLGLSPDDVTITGSVRSVSGTGTGNQNVTVQFWRTCENLAIAPTTANKTNTWAVSQGVSFRRVHVKGALSLSIGGWASGGYLADSRVDAQVLPGSQQQWYTRNTRWAGWMGGVWNMFFQGVMDPPAGTWPTQPYTVAAQAPVIREKPYLTVDSAGNYSVRVPALRRNAQGISWADGPGAGESLPIDRFHLARPGADDAATLNLALAQGKDLLLTPGVYHLDRSLQVTRAGTVVLGLGLATLVPDSGTAALEIADVGGVIVSGLVVDAGPRESSTLLQVGAPGSSLDHAANPTVLHDVFLRVGGPRIGSAATTVAVNSNNVVVDHLWAWRADHGAGAAWDVNRGRNGLVVAGDDVTAYGLFVEHYQEYQTVWNGERGRVYFYQCEMPYDPPSQDLWQHEGVKGWAGYKVGPAVKSHEAWGLGVYSAFKQLVVSENAVEAPVAEGVKLRHIVAIWLNGADGSGINNVLNGAGGGVAKAKPKVTID